MGFSFVFRFNFRVIVRMQRAGHSTPDMTEFSELLSLAGYRNTSSSAPDLSRSLSSPMGNIHQLKRSEVSACHAQSPMSSSSSYSSSSPYPLPQYPTKPLYSNHPTSCPDVAKQIEDNLCYLAQAQTPQNEYQDEDYQRQRSCSYDSLDSGDLPLWAAKEDDQIYANEPCKSVLNYPPYNPDAQTYSGWQEAGFDRPAMQPYSGMVSQTGCPSPGSSVDAYNFSQQFYSFLDQQIPLHQQYHQSPLHRHHQQQQEKQLTPISPLSTTLTCNGDVNPTCWVGQFSHIKY